MREDKEKTIGYEVSRFNAVKHGILSKETLLPHENAKDYQMLLNALESEYSPEGISEQALIEELAGGTLAKAAFADCRRSKNQ